MNALYIQEQLKSNEDYIILILEDLGFVDIKDKGGYFSFPNLDGDNKNAIAIYKDTLNYINFTRGKNGDVITLVMDTKNISFPDALRYIQRITGIKPTNITTKLPFGGIYKKLVATDIQECDLAIYDEKILEEYSGICNEMFVKDGIDLLTQEKHKVGFDLMSQRITIPQWDTQGNLVGIMGRMNSNDVPSEERWLPILPCSRSKTLYGFHYNYKRIQEMKTCFILESEKSVMQLDSLRINNCLATCGCNISSAQAKMIKGLMLDKVVIAFDEGLDEEVIREEAKKLQIDTPIFHNKVGYIYDDDSTFLLKGSKDSPTDNGHKAFRDLVKNKIVWLERS